MILVARPATLFSNEADSLEHRLRGLNVATPSGTGRSSLPGQRISEYENALAQSTPRKALGFKVVNRRADVPSDGVQLSDFPNGTCLAAMRTDLCLMPCAPY